MKPSARRVLNVLLAARGGWVRGHDLAEVGGYRFGGRLFELRHQYGFAIDRRSDPRSAVDQYRLVPEGEESASDSPIAADHVSGPSIAFTPPDLAYTNVRACECGALIPAPEPGTRGRRPRLCARCKQTRRALSYIRAGERILDSLREPERVAS
jgi:hypothetical protein